MKGVVFTGYYDYDERTGEYTLITNDPDLDFSSFPSIAFGSGTIQKEDTFRFAKRTAQGEMRRIGWIGYILKIGCKWSLLTAQEYSQLVTLTSKQIIQVSLDWKGKELKEDFYCGNMSATPYRLDGNGNPMYYTDVSFDIISQRTITK